MGNNTTDSNPIKIETASLNSKVTDVYIGVFFDGTNNNMLWMARKKVKEYCKKLKVDNFEKNKINRIIKLHEDEFKKYCEDKSIQIETADLNIKKEFIKSIININNINKLAEEAANIYNNHSEFNRNEKGEDTGKDIELFVKVHLTKEEKEEIIKNSKDFKDYEKKRFCDKGSCDYENCELKANCDERVRNKFIIGLIKKGDYKDKNAIRRFKNAHTDYKPTMLGGFSNIAILYSTYNPKSEESENAYYHLYIEGSGATDITNNNVLESEMNINGLGFGLGNTGVVALVSKAVYYVNNYIESIKSTFKKDNKVNIHFNVFGFSRGATCGRLFSYLVTRGKDESLNINDREKEFADFYAKGLYKDENNSKKLHFLENEEYNKIVDFLGIYDTVVSIGFLFQKDGYVHPLSVLYKNKMADNYTENWHYKNVAEYGMFSTSSDYNKNHKDKIKNILHICAMDEYRENFAITDIGKEVGENAVEIFIPGCHSDVGGGYYDGDEEQEILLRKSVQKGEEYVENKNGTDSDREKKSSNAVSDNARPINPSDKKVYWGKCHYFNIKRFIDVSKNIFGNKLTEEYLTNKFDLESGLNVLGWLDKNWKDAKKQKYIELNKDKVPCTIRVTNGSKYVKFKRNVKAGYSNIPLNMMIKYASKKINKENLFDKKYIEKEYPIPKDLGDFFEGIKEKMVNIKSGNRYWIHPNEEDYKKLRMKYLHFTSTYRLFHTNKPFPKEGVKFIEGGWGNIANTPNQDLNGRICRIVYHGDKEDNSLNYMYDYGENIGTVWGDLKAGEIKFLKEEEKRPTAD